MRITDSINIGVHRLMLHYVMRQYHKKSRRVEKKHPELFKPVDEVLSHKHKELWGRLGVKSGDRWLRLHVNRTGIQDYRFCPEDIFFARVERILNDCNQSGYGPEEKNNLFRYLPKGYEVDTLVRYVRGSFFDGDGHWITEKMAQDLIASENEVVGKPCRSSGGNGVVLSKNFTTEWIRNNGGESYVIQKRIRQDQFSASFNSSSINTVRMMTMRCPWDGDIVVCRSMMRMGVTDAVVDNMMKGGLCVCVGDGGKMGKYAYDYDGQRFDEHPISHARFGDLSHPYYGKMVAAAKEIHSRIMDYNLLSFDFVPREDGTICVVEINATSQGITQLQYDFGGLFGSHTEKLVDWCASHRMLDCFRHFRTWYQ